MSTNSMCCLFVSMTVWASFIGATPTRADSPFDLDSLFAVSVGGPAAVVSLQQVRYVKVTGKLTYNGQPGRFTEYLMPPDRILLELSFGQFSVAQGFDGRIAWQRDQNGRLMEISGYEKRELIKSLYFETHAYLDPSRRGNSVSYKGTVVREDTGFYLIAFIPSEGDTVLAYFNGTTGVLAQMLSRLDNVQTVTYFDNYQPVNGILTPMRTQLEAPEVPLTIEFDAESCRINEPFDSAVFSMPVEPDTGYRFVSEGDSVRVPFSYRAGHIYVPAVINGKRRVWLILDSGASATIFNELAVAEFDLEAAGTIPAKGMGGFTEVMMVRIDSLQVGDVFLYGQIGGVMDLSGIGHQGADGAPFGGVIGFDFLSRFPVLVDYGDSSLTIYRPERFRTPDGGTSVPFRLVMQVPAIEGALSGVPGDFIVDLGNAYGLILHKEFVEKNRLDTLLVDIRETGALGGVGGAVDGRTGVARSFDMGPLYLDSLRVMLPGLSQGLAGSSELAGNIGNMVLESYKVLFDYRRSQITFYPAGPAAP
ncbi:MAG: retropepsin-like aspartic protease [Candidatus Zixiibacteriota bacterium]